MFAPATNEVDPVAALAFDVAVEVTVLKLPLPEYSYFVGNPDLNADALEYCGLILPCEKFVVKVGVTETPTS